MNIDTKNKQEEIIISYQSGSEIIHMCILRLPNIVYDPDSRLDETRLGYYLHILISWLWWFCVGRILH